MDKVKDGLLNEEHESFSTWDVLLRAFLSIYIPPGKIAQLRADITYFIKKDDESLYKAQERFKVLKQQCPPHGIPNCLLVQTFYEGLNQSIMIYIDDALERALIAKLIEAMKDLLEDMASNNYHQSNEGAPSKNSSGKFNVDVVTYLASKVDTLAQRLDKISTSPTPGDSSRSSIGVRDVCETCGV